MSEKVESPPLGLGRRIRDAHLGSLFAGVAFVCVALKVLAVSHFDNTTALGIVAETGTASLLVGALIRTFPWVVLAAFFGVLAVIDDDETPESDRRLYRIAGWAVAALGAITQPVIPGVMLLVVAWKFMGGRLPRFLGRITPGQREYRRREAALKKITTETQEIDSALAGLDAEVETLRERLEITSNAEGSNPDEMERLADHVYRVAAELQRQAQSATAQLVAAQQRATESEARLAEALAARPRTRPLLRTLLVVYAGLAIVLLLSDRPWLPAEHMAVDGQSAITGYVLKADSDEVVILEDRTRQLLRIAATKVRDRRYCLMGRGASWFESPMVSLLYDAPSYPRCSGLGA